MGSESITVVIANIPEHLEPMDRGDLYEDPLDEVLQEHGVEEVTGGGSGFDPETGRISEVDLEIELTNLEQGLDLIQAVLEVQGVPRGSRLLYEAKGEQEERSIGQTEGLALWLDGVNLPDDVYQNYGLDKLYEELMPKFEDEKYESIHAVYGGETKTALFIYSVDREGLKEKIKPVIDSFPLCQNSELEDL